MRKKYNKRSKSLKPICLIIAGMMVGGIMFGAVNSVAAEEKAIAHKTWASVEKVIKTKVGAGYEEVGLCTGFLYWCLKNAYGVDWGDNSKVWQLENKLKNAGITKVAEGNDGRIKPSMKPGDIIIFMDGSQRSHCAILGTGGKLYHAVRGGVKDSHTLSGWMKMPYSEKGCDSYVVYRGLISSGALIITKESSYPELTVGNSCYSLAGAKYGLYKDGKLHGTLTTDEAGRGALGNIPYGNYMLKEISPPEGYSLDEAEYPVKIDRASVSLKVKDVPQGNEVRTVLYKTDREMHTGWSEENRGQSAATLAGAMYSVRYYDGYYDEGADFDKMKPVRSWVARSDESGQVVLDEESIVSGDPLYHSSEGNVMLPLGTVVIHELAAPEGYLLDGKEHVVQITATGEKELVDSYVAPIHTEQIIRGDLELIKTEDGTMKRLGGVPFSITSATTGESHTIVTDVNGYASTASDWNPHTNDTNGGTESSGIWFGDIGAVWDEYGALPYDTYLLDELPCEANEGMELIKGVEVKIYKDKRMVRLGTVTNDKITEESEKPEPKDADPEKPGEPDKPGEPEKAPEPDKPAEKTEFSKDEPPKPNEARTGDQIPIWLIASLNLMLVSAAGGCAVLLKLK